MKRERMEGDDDSEIMPLSKRMNNIHFNGNGESSSRSAERNGQVPSRAAPSHDHHAIQATGSSQTGHNHVHQRTDIQSDNSVNSATESSATNQIQQMEYSINKIENPIYWENNKMLFELYKDRLLRGTFPAHPDFGR